MLSSSLPEPSLAPEQILECLGAIAFGIYQTQSLYDILNAAVREARNLLQTDRVLIYRFQPDGSGVVLVKMSMKKSIGLFDRTARFVGFAIAPFPSRTRQVKFTA